MPPEELRVHGRRAVEWIAHYLEHVGELPVLAQVEPGEFRASLPPEPPESGEAMDEVLDDFERRVVPAITHWNHPSFHAYFAVTGSGPGILGEMLSAALNVNAMVWRSSPAGTELEAHALDWLRQMVGLPEGFMGVINDTASSSSLFALAAARDQAFPECREGGMAAGPRGRVYTSDQAHSSIAKAGMTLGFGRDGVRAVASDDRFRMDVGALRAAIREDVEAGIRPVAVVATVGTTSTTSVDPVVEIAEVAGEGGLWLHVDAAYAGAAAVAPEYRHHFAGWEWADSIVVNPHKWLFTPVDCSVLWCRRPERLRAAFSLTPDYLETAERGRATNLMDYGVPLGRRFRALKLWFVLRYFGREGIARRIRAHCAMAEELARAVDADPDWRRAAPAHFSTVVLRFTPPGRSPEEEDELNRTLLERANESGRIFLSHTVLGRRTWIRFSIGNLRTTERHVREGWALLRETARELASSGESAFGGPGASG